jgi:hypothetical protein
MSQDLAAHLLGVDEPRVPSLLSQLETDRWFNPSRTDVKAHTIRRAGAFRGFGGAFLHLPTVRSAQDGWIVQSGDEFWLLIADAFGATFHRATAPEWQASRDEDRAAHVGNGLRHAGSTIEIADAGPITSSASSNGAIACTFAHSYQVAVISQVAAP